MPKYLLDTNIFSYIFRERVQSNHPVKCKLEKVLRANAQIVVCPVVFYEVVRGLYQRDTRKDLNYFLLLVKQFEWCDFDREIWDSAAQLWADCKHREMSIGRNERDIDADVLIAAQVREQNAILVTSNTKHFKHFGITCENWQTQTS